MGEKVEAVNELGQRGRSGTLGLCHLLGDVPCSHCCFPLAFAVNALAPVTHNLVSHMSPPGWGNPDWYHCLQTPEPLNALSSIQTSHMLSLASAARSVHATITGLQQAHGCPSSVHALLTLRSAQGYFCLAHCSTRLMWPHLRLVGTARQWALFRVWERQQKPKPTILSVSVFTAFLPLWVETTAGENNKTCTFDLFILFAFPVLPSFLLYQTLLYHTELMARLPL